MEIEDHRAALSSPSLSPLTTVMDISQQNHTEGTFSREEEPICKNILNDLPREFMSSQAKVVIKTTEDYLQPQFGPNRRLHSAAVSEGSGLQDYSTDQTVSDHSHDEISDLDSYKSNSKNNSCFISASKRNRPVSAPEGQQRVTPFSSLKFHSAQNQHRLSQRLKHQPRVIKVTAYKNGSRTVSARVTVPTITLLLQECTEKLNLNMAARRIFLADGTEALEPEDIPHEADIYVSTGEPFLDPFKKMKDHLLLMKKVTWTMNGLMLPTDVKRQKTKPVLSVRMRKLTEKPSIRVLFFKNGMGKNGQEIAVGKETMKKVLDICTMRMNLNTPARYLYDLYGRKVKDISKVALLEKCLQNSITPLRGPVWVSKGEGFSPSGAKMYIQEVLLALYQRLKSAKIYYKQLNLVVNEQKEKITEKFILSMTAKEHQKAQDEVSKLIDELQTAIKSHRGHLSKLGPQLQAEREQFSSYVYKHIKSLPANTLVPGGLQLKIFEDGKDSGEITVCISRKDLGANSLTQPCDMMQRLLLKIHQRLQVSSSNPPGLSFSSARLFDEHGQEIKNPLLLKNEQKIWVSYGETFRSSLTPVLGLTFDQVAAFDSGGITVAYKTFLDPNSVLLPGCDNWEVCEGFPINFNYTSQQTPDQFEKLDLENHFLQNKADPNIVLHASISIGKRRTLNSEVNNPSQITSLTLWSMASVWLITKTGMILSGAITQGCLAIGHPIRVKAAEGTLLEGYKLILQKRHQGDDSQKWVFGTDGCIYSKAYPQFVLTYLEDLNAHVDVTQTEYHIHHGTWTTAHQELGSSLAEEAQPDHANIPSLKQQSESSGTPMMPGESGAPGKTGQLAVALVRKLGKKHPKASAQRWAIKHEGTNKPGQWKHSKIENPMWNKLAYIWPVLPNGQLNEEFDWPIEGLLIPNSPPTKRPIYKIPRHNVPVRLRVLQNGEKNKNKALPIIGPDVSPDRNIDTKRKDNVKNYITDYSEAETNQTDFQQLLERCTEILNLPSAARRLFNEKGKEIFALKDLQRDELVYVSCGEHWINPDLSIAWQKKQIFLRNLTSDISKIQAFCCMRNMEALVLEVQSDIVPGAKLAVHKPAAIFREEKHIIEPQEEPMQKNALTTENAPSEILDSHARAHLRMEACHTLLRYAWQGTSHGFDAEGSPPKRMEEGFFDSVEPQKKHRQLPKPSQLQKVCHQQFEYRNGQIVNHAVPQLVVGVQGPNLRSGMEVVLVEKKADDNHQYWMHKESSRTFHLVSNPDLVLAVSMTMARKQDGGYPIIVQKYKPHNNGTSNQKWNYIEDKKAFEAFHSTVLDKEITAANYAGVCTSSVIKEENIDQPGYYFLSTTAGKKKIMLCLACAQFARAEKGLKPLPPGVSFLCASSFRTQKTFSRGPFKAISVAKADLSSYEAEKTLSYYEEKLLSLRMKTCTRAVTQSGMAATHQKAVKIMAYRNGDGYQNGKLIVARTFPMLLTECTEQLGLARAASRIYTKDGTMVLSLRDLVLWALDASFVQTNSEERKIYATAIGTKEKASSSIEENLKMKAKNTLFPKFATSDSFVGMDKSLLTLILRNPIAIWVSCGEPFISPNALKKAEKLEKQNWLKKDKILTDLETMKHIRRQLKGRRIGACQPATMVPNKSPVQPVVVEGGWTEQTPEEIKLLECIRHTEAHLSEVQELQSKRNFPVAAKCVTLKQNNLYKQPNTKRVWVYLNGGRPEDGTYACGRTLSELLDDSSSRLKMSQPARTLYTPDGTLIQSWDDIKRDMVICVSKGQGFITQKELKQLMEIRANFSRIRRLHGPQATDIVALPSTKLLSLDEKVSSPISEWKTVTEKATI